MKAALRDFLRGIGQAFDLGGTHAPRRDTTDRQAIEDDWKAVGGYLRTTIEHEPTHNTKPAARRKRNQP